MSNLPLPSELPTDLPSASTSFSTSPKEVPGMNLVVHVNMPALPGSLPNAPSSALVAPAVHPNPKSKPRVPRKKIPKHESQPEKKQPRKKIAKDESQTEKKQIASRNIGKPSKPSKSSKKAKENPYVAQVTDTAKVTSRQKVVPPKMKRPAAVPRV